MRRRAEEQRTERPGASAPPPAAAAEGQQQPSDPAPAPPSSRPAGSLLYRAAGQLLVLSAALAALILLPAHLSGRLAAAPAQAAANFALYLGFFGSGTIARMLRHGSLAPSRRDAQRSSGGARAALLLFAGVAVPAGHFAAWWDPSLAAWGAGGTARTVLAAAGYMLMLGGWLLNAQAAAALGKVRRAAIACFALLQPAHSMH